MKPSPIGANSRQFAGSWIIVVLCSAFFQSCHEAFPQAASAQQSSSLPLKGGLEEDVDPAPKLRGRESNVLLNGTAKREKVFGAAVRMGNPLSGRMGNPFATNGLLQRQAATSLHADGSTCVNLNECIPKPTDPAGSYYWAVLDAERKSWGRSSWQAWIEQLRNYVAYWWPLRGQLAGHANLHVVVHRGGVVTSIETIPGCFDCNKGFVEDCAEQFVWSLSGNPVLKFPAGSQVEQVHLQILLDNHPNNVRESYPGYWHQSTQDWR